MCKTDNNNNKRYILVVNMKKKSQSMAQIYYCSNIWLICWIYLPFAHINEIILYSQCICINIFSLILRNYVFAFIYYGYKCFESIMQYLRLQPTSENPKYKFWQASQWKPSTPSRQSQVPVWVSHISDFEPTGLHVQGEQKAVTFP